MHFTESGFQTDAGGGFPQEHHPATALAASRVCPGPHDLLPGTHSSTCCVAYMLPGLQLPHSLDEGILGCAGL